MISDVTPPSICILTPVYSWSGSVGKYISSVMKQERLTHIIVDDGSTDGTCWVLEEYR